MREMCSLPPKAEGFVIFSSTFARPFSITWEKRVGSTSPDYAQPCMVCLLHYNSACNNIAFQMQQGRAKWATLRVLLLYIIDQKVGELKAPLSTPLQHLWSYYITFVWLLYIPLHPFPPHIYTTWLTAFFLILLSLFLSLSICITFSSVKMNPRMDIHKRENLEICFRFIREVEKIHVVNIGKSRKKQKQHTCCVWGILLINKL